MKKFEWFAVRNVYILVRFEILPHENMWIQVLTQLLNFVQLLDLSFNQ